MFIIIIHRKIAHLVSGLILLSIPRNKATNTFCVAYALYLAARHWLGYPLRFSKHRDPGITFFAVMLIYTIYKGIPMYILGPLFFADPLAAIIGRNIKSKNIYGAKTSAGTLTVFVVSWMTLYYVPSAFTRLVLSAVVALCELLGGEYDNMIMAVPLLVYHHLYL